MIAYGCLVNEAEPYRRYAEPGIRLVAEPGDRVYPFAPVGPMGRGNNLLMRAAAACADLEALVLVHPHTQIDDRGFPARVREAFAESDVAVLGPIGARGSTTLAWWEGAISSGPVVHRYTENGGGELPAYAWAPHAPAPADVDVVDGFLMVLSPWAVRNVAFDEGLFAGHGFDVDFCRRVRAAGRRVRTIDSRVIQHRSLELVSDMELWVESHAALARAWAAEQPVPDGEWEARARRAEAEREAARSLAYSRRLAHDARVAELERRLERLTTTGSWKLTRPLRELNRVRRALTRPPG